MFLDLNHNPLPQTEVDVAIIGCGAVGILLSCQLIDAGFSVRVFESGGFEEDPKRQSLNEFENTGADLDASPTWGRKRAIGGTTIAWGGQALRLSANDFEQREWIEESGWPIGLSELLPHYETAERFMGLDPMGYTDEAFRRLGIMKPFVGDELDYHVSKWATQPNFAKLHKRRLESEDLQVIYNAQVTGLLEDDGKVTLQVANFKGQVFSSTARKVVLANGGIESVRLMLVSELSNSPWLGVGFMEHPCIEVGHLSVTDTYELQRLFATRFLAGRKYSIRMSLSPRTQAERELLACSASLMFEAPAGDDDAYQDLKMLFGGDVSVVPRLILAIPKFVRTAYTLVFHRFLFKAGAQVNVVLMTEQEPSGASLISLADHSDQFGVPKAKINWDITHKSWETVVSMVQILKKMFHESFDVDLVPKDFLTVSEKDPHRRLSAVNHHMGGARMSATRTEGVVDSNLKVWGASSVYICSASVFPTSSHSNPTLTVLALGCRLVEHLRHAD